MKKWIAVGVVVFVFLFAGIFICNQIASSVTPQPAVQSETLNQSEEQERTRYYYDRLSVNAKEAYDIILSEIRTHPEKIEIPVLTTEEYESMFEALSYDNPELLCMTNESQKETRGATEYFIPQYFCDATECEQRRNEMEATVDQILASVPANLSDYEKELFFHDWLCENFTYETADSTIGYSTYDGFVLGRAVCEGYSRGMQLLLNRSGIPNYLATGMGINSDGESEGHMWNVITLDGKNYYLDVTWDDLDASEIGQFCHAYFNVPESDIAENHLDIVPQNNNCVSDDANYFVVNHLAFEAYDNETEAAITNEIIKAYQEGSNTFEIRFTNDSAYQTGLKELTQNGDIYKLIENAGNEVANAYDEAVFSQDDSVRIIQFALR